MSSFAYRHVKREKDTWIRPTQIPTTAKFWANAQTWFSIDVAELNFNVFRGGTSWIHQDFMVKDTGASAVRETMPLNVPFRTLHGTTRAEMVGADMTQWPQELQKSTEATVSTNNVFSTYDQYRIEAINHMFIFRNFSTTPHRVMWRLIKFSAGLVSATLLSAISNPFDEGDIGTTIGGDILYDANDWNVLDVPGSALHGTSLFRETQLPIKCNILSKFPDKDLYKSGRDDSFSSFVVAGPRMTPNAIGIQMAVLRDTPHGQATTGADLLVGMSANWLFKIRKTEAT